MADPRIKQIKIKTGVVKRCTREISVYEKEVIQEKERYEKMKLEGADEFMLRKQKEVIGESENMVPDTRRRLTTATEDLSNVLKTEADLKETEEYQEAEMYIGEAKLKLAD